MPRPPAPSTSAAVSSMVSGRFISDRPPRRAAGAVDGGASRAELHRDAAAGAARRSGDQGNLSCERCSHLARNVLNCRASARRAWPLARDELAHPVAERDGRSRPANSASPEPSSTGAIARCISSISPARRYCRIVATPPPTRTSRAARPRRRLLERGVDAVGDEVEGRAALHLERRARVVRQHEHRHVVGRVVAPPALPGVVGPRRRGSGRTCCGRGSRRRCSRCRARRSRRRRRSCRRLAAEHALRNVRVGMNHSCSASPPTPSGFSRLWSGPAP